MVHCFLLFEVRNLNVSYSMISFFSKSLSDVLSGYNGTIFAYGQTASGKTHTMEVSAFIVLLLLLVTI